MNKNKLYLYAAWITALVATMSSLYLSEVKDLAPCVLCWYQRIFMYPLALLIPIGILRRNRDLPLYVLPMSIMGMAIALYHYLLQAGILPESAAPCVAGISCTTRHIIFFDFLTIPLLSLIAFGVISILMTLAWRSRHEQRI